MAISLKKHKIKDEKKAQKKEKAASKKHDREEGKKVSSKAKEKDKGKKAKKSKTTQATFRNITCKTCEKPIHKGGVPEGTPHKCCPKCGSTKAIGEKAIEEKFGYREWQGRKIPQSSCRTCRGQWAKENGGSKAEKPKSKKDKGKKAKKKSRD